MKLNLKNDPRNLSATGVRCFLVALGRSKSGCGDAHNSAVGVDTRSGAGFAHRLARSDRDDRREAPSCPCKPNDVLRPVCKPWLALWRGPCGQVARRKAEQGQTARRRYRRHVVNPDRYQFAERATKDQVAHGAAVVLRRSRKPCGKNGDGHSPSPVASGASTSTRIAMPFSPPGL